MIFYNPSLFNEDLINNFPQLAIIDEMLDHPTLEEIEKTIKRVSTDKAPGFDVIHVKRQVCCRDSTYDFGRTQYWVDLILACLRRKCQNRRVEIIGR